MGRMEAMVENMMEPVVAAADVLEVCRMRLLEVSYIRH
jgi:hypothetical protein